MSRDRTNGVLVEYVSGCSRCPFEKRSPDQRMATKECGAPGADAYALTSATGAPNSCPLRQGPITVRLR